MAVDKCCICGGDGRKQCGTCKSINYCSINCQKKDWPLHKLLCAKFKPFIEVGPPLNPVLEANATYKLAILFAVKSIHPELIWVKCLNETLCDDGITPYYEYENIQSGLKDRLPFARPMPSSRYGHMLQTYMDDDAIGRTPPNGCYRFLNAGYQEVDLSIASIGPSRFCGDLVVFRCRQKLTPVTKSLEEGEFDDIAHDNITLADLRHVFEFMTAENSIFDTDNKTPFYIRTRGEWIKAVKISCSGDMKFMGKPKYREVAVRSSHAIFSPRAQVDISKISEQMGFPLLVQKMEIDRSWYHKATSDPAFDPCENGEVIFLMRNLDVNSKLYEWGTVAQKWDNGIDHTALVVRKDKKDLIPQQIEVFIQYIKDEIIEYIWREDGDDEMRYSRALRQNLIDMFMTSGKFAKFFENFQDEKVKSGDASWADVKFIGDV